MNQAATIHRNEHQRFKLTVEYCMAMTNLLLIFFTDLFVAQ